MSDRYAENDKIRAGVDEAIDRRAAQSDEGLADREQNDPAGESTVSGKADRDSVVGGHGHGGEIDLEIEKASGS